MRPTILIIADWYLPGYKAGGVITALANLVEGIGDDFDLRIIARDRDLTDAEPYPAVGADKWQPVGKAQVFYARDFTLAHLRQRIVESRPDIVYLNSFFSPITVKILALRTFGLLSPAAFAIAPRGEVSPGALQIKPHKKFLYAAVALRAGLYSDLLWHATSVLEFTEIDRFLRARSQKDLQIHIASDLPNRDWSTPDPDAVRATKSSPVNFPFLSRICRKKNLLVIVDALASLSAPAELHIYGPIDDPAYWYECQSGIAALPQNVRATYHGAVARELVPSIFRAHDFLLLPTEGENFGYVLFESLAAGCPIIVSDRTPLRDLHENGVGWAIPLEDRASWCQTFASCAKMDSPTHAAMSLRAREYVQAWLAQSDPRRATIEMFQSLVEKQTPSESAAAVPAAVVAGATRSKSI
jgi:glycosyltransferase involved in cell wall biosynthesis